MLRALQAGKTTLPVFNKTHNALRMRLWWYYQWHLIPGISYLHIAVAVISVVGASWFVFGAYPRTTLASANQKVWTSQADFEGGTLSHIDTTTTPGTVSLASSATSLTEGFTATTNYNSGTSSNVNWDTTNHHLQLGGATDGTITDLTANLKAAWKGGEKVFTTYDSFNGRIYYGGSAGSFGYYTPATDTYTDLSTLLLNAWMGTQVPVIGINALTYDSVNHLVYVVGNAAYSFAVTDGSTVTSLSSKLSGKWNNPYGAYALAYDPTHQLVYISGYNGDLISYDGTTATNLRAQMIAGSFQVGVTHMVYNTTDNLLYMGGSGSRFGKFDGTTATDLTGSISTYMNSGDIADVTFDPTHNLIYLLAWNGNSGELVKYDGSTATDLGLSGAGIGYSLSYEASSGILYIGGRSGVVRTYNGSAFATVSALSTPLSANGPYLGIYSSVDSTNHTLYFTTDAGNFVKYDGSTVTDKSSGLLAVIQTFPVTATAVDSVHNKLFIGGTSAHFAVFDGTTVTDLSSKLSGIYGDVTGIGYDGTHNYVYFGTYLGSYLRKMDGTTGNIVGSINLGGMGNGSWYAYRMRAFAYDSTHNMLYVGADGNHFAKYDGTTITDISSTISSWNGSADIYSLLYVSGTNTLYLGTSSGKFGSYDGSSATNLTANLTGWGSNVINALAYDTSNSLIYLGGGAGKFGKYSGSTFTDLSTPLGFGSTQNVYSLVMKGTTVYAAGGPGTVGASSGALFKSYNGSAVTDFSTTVQGVFATRVGQITSAVNVNNTLYLAGMRTSLKAAFAKLDIGYTAAGTAYTNTLDTSAQNIKTVTVTPTVDLPTGAAVAYSASADGGSHWESITAGVAHTFTNAGSDLRLKLDLSTSDPGVTPTITNLAVSYTALDSATGSVILTFDASRTVNMYQLSQTASVPAGTTLSYKVRTAATADGLAAASWGSPISSLPHSLTSETTDNRFVQIEADLASTDGLTSPSISDLTLDYIDNDYPGIQTLTQTYATDGSNDLTVSYQLQDNEAAAKPGGLETVAVTLAYSLDNGDTWSTIPAGDLAGVGSGDARTTVTSTFADKSTTVHLGTLLPSSYSAAFKVRVTINDLELARNTTSLTSSATTIDTAVPTAPSFSITDGDANASTVTLGSLTASDASALSKVIASTNSGFTGADWQDYAASIPGVPATAGATVYVKFKDAYGNVSVSTSRVVPPQVQHVIISDLSNAASSDYRLALGWSAITDNPSVTGYKVYRATNSGSKSLLATVSSSAQNSYVDATVTPGNSYHYSLYALYNTGDLGLASELLSAQPSFTPTLATPTVSATGDTWVTLAWTSDVAADSFIEFGTTTSYGAIQGSTDTGTTHSLTLSGLTQSTAYHARARGKDAAGTLGLSSDMTFSTAATPADPVPTITLGAAAATYQNMTIAWTTNVPTDSFVEYGTTDAYGNIFGKADNTTSHSVIVPNLAAATTYHYRVRSRKSNGTANFSSDQTITTAAAPVPVLSAPTISATYNTITVSWTSEVATDSFVEYGPSTQYGLTAGSFTTDTAHAVTINGVAADTTYHLRVRGRNGSGTTGFGTDQRITTAAAPVPAISGVAAGSITYQAATISFTTDTVTDAVVQYGLTDTYGASATNTDEVLTHAVGLTGLAPSMTYHYRVRSRNSLGILGYSTDKTFVTTALPTPAISSIKVDAPTDTTVTISWTTDLPSTSYVDYGKDNSYGETKGSEAATTAHSINLSGLTATTSYHYRLRSTGAVGGVGSSADATFTTAAIPALNQSALKPTIQKVAISNVTFDSAVVSWETTEVTKSQTQYGTSLDYGQSVQDQSANFTTQHTVLLSGLTKGQAYHLRVLAQDQNDNIFASDDYLFTTLALPSITTTKLSNITSDGGTLSWTTTTPTTTSAVYTDSPTADPDQVVGVDSPLSTDHAVTFNNLKPAVTYRVKAKSSDAYGNTVYSDILPLATTVDVAPPQISDLRSDTTLVTTDNGSTKVQAIISWTTNEPATTQIQYNEGIVTPPSYANSSPLDPALSTSHVVVVGGLKTSATYKLVALSADASKNISVSNEYTILTKQQQQSMLQVIVSTLQDSFSWIKKLKF